MEEFKNEQKKKNVIRPNINTRRILLLKVSRLVVAVGICFLARTLCLRRDISSVVVWTTSLIAVFLFLAQNAKDICCEWILLYQKYAPERVRNSCLFEPSCSQYMLLAIEKYGTFKGVIKGIHRLLRCHPPNGGNDDP